VSLITATSEAFFGRDLAPAICGLFALAAVSVLVAVCIDPQQFAPILGEAPYP
jgi:hypothetical protein